jgi:hypothetical protein
MGANSSIRLLPLWNLGVSHQTPTISAIASRPLLVVSLLWGHFVLLLKNKAEPVHRIPEATLFTSITLLMKLATNSLVDTHSETVADRSRSIQRLSLDQVLLSWVMLEFVAKTMSNQIPIPISTLSNLSPCTTSLIRVPVGNPLTWSIWFNPSWIQRLRALYRSEITWILVAGFKTRMRWIFCSHGIVLIPEQKLFSTQTCHDLPLVSPQQGLPVDFFPTCTFFLLTSLL